ncbi:MAG: hypothetical protein ABI668_01050 [Sphingorhabdus sp.]
MIGLSPVLAALFVMFMAKSLGGSKGVTIAGSVMIVLLCLLLYNHFSVPEMQRNDIMGLGGLLAFSCFGGLIICALHLFINFLDHREPGPKSRE